MALRKKNRQEKKNKYLARSLEVTGGPLSHRLFVLDELLKGEEVTQLYTLFRNLPYRFTASDRLDTQEYRHFGYDFVEEPVTEHPVVGFFANIAMTHLRSHGIDVGRVKRAYVNVNLYGDVQFAHQDGDEWTAVVFLNASWNSDWGGELLIYSEPYDSLAYAITPAPGRMVLFDGLLLHRGGVPSKLTGEPRITLAIKMSR